MAPLRGESGYLTRYASRFFTSVALSFPASRTRTCNSVSGSRALACDSGGASALFGFAEDCGAAAGFFAGAFAGGADEGGGFCCPQAKFVISNARKYMRLGVRRRIGAIVTRNEKVCWEN